MRKNLVILFYHGSECSLCRKKLKRFAESYEELEELRAKILAISSDRLERSEKLSAELGPPCPLLSDPEGSVIGKYTYWGVDRKVAVPSVFVTDRYGTLYYQHIANEITGIPDLAKVLSWLEFIQSQCPECSI
jgi:peroxiredoxin